MIKNAENLVTMNGEKTEQHFALVFNSNLFSHKCMYSRMRTEGAKSLPL